MTKTRGVLWNCLCNCGKNIELPSNALTSGNNITCGNKSSHIGEALDPRWFQYKEISISYLNSIKQNSIKINREYNLSPEYLWELYINQNKKCFLSGIEICFKNKLTNSEQTASLDRIDCSKGYVEGNVRWVHKWVNIMRSNFTDEEFIYFCKNCYLQSLKINRPNWTEYFLNIAKDVSLRSDDPDIQHGCVITTFNHHIIGTGYNATIKGSDLTRIPLHIRDEKRKYMIHAEENAILNSLVNPLNIDGAIMYITAKPCVNCLQRIINFGIKEIVYIDAVGTITENEETEKMRQLLVEMSGIKMCPTIR